MYSGVDNIKYAPDIKYLGKKPCDRINEFMDLFSGKREVSGKDIIKYMNLSNTEYTDNIRYRDNTKLIDDFFKYFYDKNIILIEHDVMSVVWIDNNYVLNKQWVREYKINKIING
jgi:hypothetical protein